MSFKAKQNFLSQLRDFQLVIHHLPVTLKTET